MEKLSRGLIGLSMGASFVCLAFISSSAASQTVTCETIGTWATPKIGDVGALSRLGASRGQDNANGTSGDLYFLRGCLAEARTDQSDATKVNTILDGFAVVYDRRVRRQSDFVGSFSYASVLGAIGAASAPDWGYLSAIPMVIDRIEDFNSTRALYSVGSSGLGLVRGYYADLETWQKSIQNVADKDKDGRQQACDAIQTLRPALAAASAERNDADMLFQVCERLEGSETYLDEIVRLNGGEQNAQNTQKLNNAMTCDVIRLDRLLAHRDEAIRVGPQDAVTGALAIIPTVIQGLVAREDLKLQNVGRIQRTISGLTLRIGTNALAQSLKDPPPVPTTIAQLNDASFANPQSLILATHRRMLLAYSTKISAQIGKVTTLRAALQPVLLEYNFDPATETIRASRLSNQATDAFNVNSSC